MARPRRRRNTSASSPFAVGASFAGAQSCRSFFPSNTLAAARPAAGSGFFASALELVDRGGEAEASPARGAIGGGVREIAGGGGRGAPPAGANCVARPTPAAKAAGTSADERAAARRLRGRGR